jgi:hypothetical protein
MVRRTDRPLGQVRVSFETTRSGPQHLIEAYAVVVPEVRHRSDRSSRNKAGWPEAKVAVANIRRGER